MLDRILQLASRASQWVVWMGGALLIFAAVMTTIDVLLRKFFSWSFGGADEIAGYLFAISTAFAFAFAMLHRAHVRIDALYLVLPRPIRICLDFLGFILLGGFLGLMTERAFSVWWGSYENSSVSITPLVTPLALPQGFWFAGLVFVMVVFALVLVRLMMALLQRDWTRISALIGARSVEEEVEVERKHAEAELEREHDLIRQRELGGGD